MAGGFDPAYICGFAMGGKDSCICMQFFSMTWPTKDLHIGLAALVSSCSSAQVVSVFLCCFVSPPPSSACADVVHAGTADSSSAELLHVHES